MDKPKITSLPLKDTDRKEFVDTANLVFESVINRMEPQNPNEIRELWDAEHYIDNILLQENMLPIDRDYALSLIDAFLVHYVLELVSQTDPRSDQEKMDQMMNDPELLEQIAASIENDEDDPTLKPGLTCHVELDCDNDAMAAWALRAIAKQIEEDNLESGFHPVKTPNGKKIGEIYLDHFYESTV